MNVEITIPAQSVTIPSQDVSVNIPAAQIVYSHAWIGQTSAFGPINLFAPATDGQYRITTAILAAATSGTGTVNVNAGIGYYPHSSGDGTTAGSVSLPGSGPLENQGWYVFSVSGKAGDALTLQTELYSSGTAAVLGYDLYVTIEQLQ